MIYLFYQKSSMARNPSHSVKYQKGLKKPLAFNFQDKMKKALAKRHLGKALIGTIALKAISDFFLEKWKKYWEIEWFVKIDKLFLNTYNHALKIDSYRYQKEILEYINSRLLWASYDQKISKILFAK